MKSKGMIVIALLFLLFTVSGEAAEKIIKVGHSNDTSSPYHTAALVFAKRVAELTQNKVEVQVFPSSQLGSLRENMEGLQVGTLEMTVPNSAVAANFVKEFDIFNLPFLFDDFQHLYKIFDSKIGEEINAACIKKGLRIVSWWAGGTRSVYARKPAGDLTSMKGFKIRTLQSPVVIDTWKSLGLIPTPMPMQEVYTALQQGIVDAGEGSIISYEGARYYEVAPYISDVKYLYTVALFMIGETSLKSLSQQHQQAILQAAKESVPLERKLNEEKENEVRDKLRKTGKVTIVTPDLQPFRHSVQPVYEKYGKAMGIDKIKWIQSYN